MSAQAWKIYNKAKKKIGNGTIVLAAATKFRVTLHTSAANIATLTLSAYGSATSEVGSVASSYSSSGKPCTSVQWTVGASAKQYMFKIGNFFWSANSQISNIKFAALWVSGATTINRHMLAFTSLTATQFNLAAGNRLTVQIASGGAFTLV